MAPVVAALRGTDAKVDVRVALTGQHTTLVDQVLEAFDMRPDYDLDLMREDQTLYDVVEGALRGLGAIVSSLRPDVLLAQGDTATVFVASLVGFIERVRVGHVEAGLRSGDKWAPYPEEMFRRLSDVLSDMYFAPTRQAAANLRREGFPDALVHVTGNTVVDAVLQAARRPHEIVDPVVREVAREPALRMVLLTAHRRESYQAPGPVPDAPLRDVFAAVRALADRHEDVVIVYPVHPNPSVSGPARALLSGHPRIVLTDPLGYLDMVAAMRHASLILTDSGGIQEEAPSLGTPVVVLREVTERPEAVAAGVATLAGTDPERILVAAGRALEERSEALGPNPFGDGHAGRRIADVVVAELTGRPRRIEDWSG